MIESCGLWDGEIRGRKYYDQGLDIGVYCFSYLFLLQTQKGLRKHQLFSGL